MSKSGYIFHCIMPLTLRVSDELVLRLMRPDEAPVVFREVDRNRLFLRQWLPWIDASRSPFDSRPHLEHSWNAYHQGDGFSMGIMLDEEYIGMIGFHAFDKVNRITSVGYWLAERYCGRGIMTQSVARAIDYAMDDRNINRLYIRCATGNRPSRAIPERLGFVHEGVQRESEWLYDHFVDLEVYSILAREWKSHRRRTELDANRGA